MTEPVSNRGRESGRGETPPGMPRWVKVSALVAFGVVVALVVIMLLVGGGHGPDRHTGAVVPPGIVSRLL